MLDVRRGYWGIEVGLHQALDAAMNTDYSRVQTSKSAHTQGLYRLLAVSLAVPWLQQQPTHRTTPRPATSKITSVSKEPTLLLLWSLANSQRFDR